MKKVGLMSFVISLILLFVLTGCQKMESADIKTKLNAELEYVEDLIFKISNKYAKVEYFEEDKFKWEEVKDDIEKINSSWGTLVLDLTEVNVQNQDIIDFSNTLNNLLITVSNEDDVEMIDRLNQLYEKVIIFKEAYSENKNQIKKNKIKSEVLSIFDLANKDDYDSAKKKATEVVETYKGYMNDISYAEENAYNLNKIYILLEEYSNAVQTQNYDLIRMKYIVTVESL